MIHPRSEEKPFTGTIRVPAKDEGVDVVLPIQTEAEPSRSWRAAAATKDDVEFVMRTEREVFTALNHPRHFVGWHLDLRSDEFPATTEGDPISDPHNWR